MARKFNRKLKRRYKKKSVKKFKNRVARIARREILRQDETKRLIKTLNNNIIDSDSQATPSGGWQGIAMRTPFQDVIVMDPAGTLKEQYYWTKPWIEASPTYQAMRRGLKVRNTFISIKVWATLKCLPGANVTNIIALQPQNVRMVIVSPPKSQALSYLDAYLAGVPTDVEFPIDPNRAVVHYDKTVCLCFNSKNSTIFKWKKRLNKDIYWQNSDNSDIFPVNDLRVFFTTANADYGSGSIQFVQIDGWMKVLFKDS